jgi:hypothetical protein
MRTDFFNNLDIFGNRTPEEKARDLGRSIWRIFGDEEYTDPASKWSEVNQRDIKSLLNDGADADYQENGKSILDNIIGGNPQAADKQLPRHRNGCG